MGKNLLAGLELVEYLSTNYTTRRLEGEGPAGRIEKGATETKPFLA
jgi:hypothetical protein